jgi:hypothetical protein
VITAGVFSQIGFDAPLAGPLSVSFSTETMVVPLGGLRFYDADSRAESRFAFDQTWFSAGLGVSADLGPIAAQVAYRYQRDWYYLFGSADPDLVAPDDHLHRGTIDLAIDQREMIANGAGYDGFALALGGTYDYYAGFDRWGTDAFVNDAPDHGLGTFTYRGAISYGETIGRRIDTGVQVAGFAGTESYTRSLVRLGTPMFGDESPLYIRGVPAGSIEAERGVVAHAQTGVSVVPGTLHLSVFYDGALVEAPQRVLDETGLVHATGLSASFSLPWSIQMVITYAHSFHTLDGDDDGSRDMLSIQLARLFAF